MRTLSSALALPCFLLFAPLPAMPQAVKVTMRLDTNALPLGTSTTLRVFAQVAPNLRSISDQIFSWYVDVLNTNGAVALADYSRLLKSASDNDPEISSTGFTDGSNRRGIYDTFLKLPGAGVTNPVELLAIRVTGLALGQTRFSVRAGTGVEALAEDFIVAPLSGGNPLTGGDYSEATIDLRVLDPCSPRLQLTPLNGNAGVGQRLQISFTPCVGLDHTIEYRDDLLPGTQWQPLSGAPHNSGSTSVTNTVPRRFFRVRANRTDG